MGVWLFEGDIQVETWIVESTTDQGICKVMQEWTKARESTMRLYE